MLISWEWRSEPACFTCCSEWAPNTAYVYGLWLFKRQQIVFLLLNVCYIYVAPFEIQLYHTISVWCVLSIPKIIEIYAWVPSAAFVYDRWFLKNKHQLIALCILSFVTPFEIQLYQTISVWHILSIPKTVEIRAWVTNAAHGYGKWFLKKH